MHLCIANSVYKNPPDLPTYFYASKGSEGLRAKGSRNLGGSKCQLRNHETTTILGTPDEVVREAIDVGVERAIGVDEHVSNEELFANLEQEERAVAVRAEPLAMVLDELNDLSLREAQRIQVGSETAVDLLEGSVLGHLVNLNVLGFRWVAFHVGVPVDEVAVEVAVEEVTCFCDDFVSVSRTEGERFRSRDKPEAVRGILSHFREEVCDELLSFSGHMVASPENPLHVFTIECSVLFQFGNGGFGTLASGVFDDSDALFFLSCCNRFHTVINFGCVCFVVADWLLTTARNIP